MALFLIKVDPPSTPYPRFARELFNLAHVPLFMMVGFLLWQQLIKHFKVHLGTLIVCLLLTLLFGITIEFFQTFTGRTASWNDIQLNVIGLAIFLVFGPANLPLKTKSRQIICVITLPLLTIKSIPLCTAILDYSTIIFQPALLSDFESPGQGNRWDRGEVIPDPEVPNNHVLLVPLRKDSYTGSTLDYLPRDWQNYSTLHLEIFSAETSSQKLHIKVRDTRAIHEGDQYPMQFNHVKSIIKGWNSINIPMKSIAHGPHGRLMDLQQIHALSLFFSQRDRPGYVLLDNLRLE